MFNTIYGVVAGAGPILADIDNPFDDVEPSSDALGSEFVSVTARLLGAFWWAALMFTAFCAIYAIFMFLAGSRQSSPHEVNKGKKALLAVFLGVVLLVSLPMLMDVAINILG